MTRTAHTAAATTSPVRAPRRQRVGAAVASAVVTACMFASVVLGMTSTGDAGPAVIAQSNIATPA